MVITLKKKKDNVVLVAADDGEESVNRHCLGSRQSWKDPVMKKLNQLCTPHAHLPNVRTRLGSYLWLGNLI
jgi:hypothetical protein